MVGSSARLFDDVAFAAHPPATPLSTPADAANITASCSHFFPSSPYAIIIYFLPHHAATYYV
jgi:hypothetical protein